MDKMRLCGSRDLGSIPSGSTKRQDQSIALVLLRFVAPTRNRTERSIFFRSKAEKKYERAGQRVLNILKSRACRVTNKIFRTGADS